MPKNSSPYSLRKPYKLPTFISNEEKSFSAVGHAPYMLRLRRKASYYMFLHVLRARQRSQNMQKHIQKPLNTRELSYLKKRLDIVKVVATAEKQKRTPQGRSYHNA